MATNKVYQIPETAIVFTESGGDATFTPKNCANGAGRISAQYDRGSGAKAMRYKWEAKIKAQSALAVGVIARIYAYCAHEASGSIDNGASDAAVSAETQYNNWALIGQIQASAGAVGPFYAAGIVELFGRYISVGFWNATGQSLTNTDGDNKITLTPIPEDIQAAT